MREKNKKTGGEQADARSDTLPMAGPVRGVARLGLRSVRQHPVQFCRAELRANAAAIADRLAPSATRDAVLDRSEEHTSELQSLMRISYAVFCLKKKKKTNIQKPIQQNKQIKNT